MFESGTRLWGCGGAVTLPSLVSYRENVVQLAIKES